MTPFDLLGWASKRLTEAYPEDVLIDGISVRDLREVADRAIRTEGRAAMLEETIAKMVGSLRANSTVDRDWLNERLQDITKAYTH